MVPSAHSSPQSKQHLDQFSHFAGLTSVTVQQTDHAAHTYIVLRCGLIIHETNEAQKNFNTNILVQNALNLMAAK